jgi:Zn-finger nucleic acid-binding protein
MCGAAAATDATKCQHCGARLATIACPSCFGMMFVGAKFCSHCGAKADRSELSETARQLCPRCGVGMSAVKIGSTDLRECLRCEGLWGDADTLQRIYTDREQQAALLGVAKPLPTVENLPLEKVRYLPCPVCRQLMHRVNFARCSHVVVDVCKPHGTWFDKDELRRIVEFIQAGGFDKAREVEIADLERQRHELEAVRTAGSVNTRPDYSSRHGGLFANAFEAAAGAVVDSFFR